MAQMAERDSGNYGLARGGSINSQEGLAQRPASIGGHHHEEQYHDDSNPFADPTVAQQQPHDGAAGQPGAQNPDDEGRKKPFFLAPAFIIGLWVTLVLGLVLLFTLLYPLVHGIAQRIINVANLDIRNVSIRNPTNTSFDAEFTGLIYNTGHINAKLTFNQVVNIFWVEGSLEHGNETETKLGSTFLAPVYSRSARATLDQSSTFKIEDEAAMGRFTSTLINAETFTWRLKSEQVKAEALKFPIVNGLTFVNDVTLPGINSFNNNVRLADFQLPGDAPNGTGMLFTAVTTLHNPSPIDVALGDVAFDLFYEDVYLGRGTGSGVSLAAMADSNVTLSGTLVEHRNDSTALAKLGPLFSSYISGDSSPVTAKGVYTRQANGDKISWLSDGIEALTLTVPLKSPEPINPIKSIDISYLNLSFTPETQWAPITNSDAVRAQLELPFGFTVNISDIAETFTLYQNNTGLASLSTPVGAAKSDIRTYGPKNISGPVDIDLKNAPLTVGNDVHSQFQEFTKQLTTGNLSQFLLVGHARSNAVLPIGNVTLDPIKFNVSSSLKGLNSLNTRPTNIRSVDVVGGTTDHINLDILVDLYNPSSINLEAGDVFFGLYRNDTFVGTNLLRNLNLKQGLNSLPATTNFTPNAAGPAGSETLNQYLAGNNVSLSIHGYQNSTSIESLLPALEALTIQTVLPGLNQSLLNSTFLRVLPTTGHGDNITHVTVALRNPFTAGLSITYIDSTVHAFGLDLGNLTQSVTGFNPKGKAITTSPNFNFDLNLDTPTLLTLLRMLAVEAKMTTVQLDGITKIGGYSYVKTNETEAFTPSKRALEEMELNKRDNIYTGFLLPPYVHKAFAYLNADVALKSNVLIGEYNTSIDYVQKNVPVYTDQSLDLILPIIAGPIVQKIVDQATLGLDGILIMEPGEETFNVGLTGNIGNAGPFDAEIAFPQGLNISWNGNILGSINMPNITVVGDQGAKLNMTAAFKVSDKSRLSEFTKTLITTESFEWDISGNGLAVNALGITVPNVTFAKTVPLKGFNGLKNAVTVDSYDLPSNDPAGGIHLTLKTTIKNPSSVGLTGDALTFQNFFASSNIGPVSAENFVLKPASSSQLPLTGRLIKQDGQTGLDDLGDLFTNYVHGKDNDVKVNGESATGGKGVKPSWLQDGIKALSIDVVLPSPKDLKVIKSIDLSDLELDFTPGTAWAPKTTTKNSLASFELPFAFPLDVKQLSSQIAVGYQGQDIAVLPLPTLNTKTNIKDRTVQLAFSDVPFNVYGDKHNNFEDFLRDATIEQKQTFQLGGNADTLAGTAAGDVKIRQIAFDVSTTIAGLHGFKDRPTTVSDLDVYHGYSGYLQINLDTHLYNPSNLTVGLGDVDFALKLQDKKLGLAILRDAKIVPGAKTYPTEVHYQPSDDAKPAGKTLLQNYISGINTTTDITGDSQTTDVASLTEALEALHLSTVVPGIKVTLIRSASIKFPDDVATNGGKAQTSFVLANPFTASINLNKIYAKATYNKGELALGTIDTSVNPAIHADGHSTITSPSLTLNFNLDPVVIIKLLTEQAAKNKVNLGPLPDLFKIVLADPNFQTDIKASKSSDNSCKSNGAFDVNGAILASLKNLKTDLAISSDLHLDDYGLSLDFDQNQVTTNTDSSALNLLPVVAPPIVQKLVDQSKLSFSIANATDLTNGGFSLALAGSLTAAGPLDALIEFPDGLDVFYSGNKIAEITIDAICSPGNTNVPNLRKNAKLRITDQGRFTDFSTYILHNKAFTWNVKSNNVHVTALGFTFRNVKLSKDLTFQAFNNLPGVVVRNFDLPGDSPQGGITISSDADIPSPSNLGIDLGAVGFTAFYKGVEVGPLNSDKLFLAPKTTTRDHLDGRITPKSGGDLATIGDLFSDFLAGKNISLQIKGNYARGAQNDNLSWLTPALRTLTLDVTLPGQIFTIIRSITLSDLEVSLLKDSDDYNVPTSTKATKAVFRNPYKFSLKPLSVAENLIINLDGTDVAQLNVPNQPVDSDASTGNDAQLSISFTNVPLKSLNNGGYQKFFAEVTNTGQATPLLKGSVNIVAQTSIGNVPISGIPFNVTSPIKGINNFGGKGVVKNLTIQGGTPQYIIAPLNTGLTNPSNVSLSTNKIRLPSFSEGHKVGYAVLDPFNLVPGEKDYPTEFRYEPDNANDTDAQLFLTQYLSQSGSIPLTVQGSADSSPYGSLSQALDNLELSTPFNGIGGPDKPLVSNLVICITTSVFIDNYVRVAFDINNPLDTDFTVKYVQADSGVDGDTYAQFSTPINLRVPAHGKANTGYIEHVYLPKGAFGTLPITVLGYQDVFSRITVDVGEYEIPWLQYNLAHVNADYRVDLLGDTCSDPTQPAPFRSDPNRALQQLSSISASSVAHTQSLSSLASVSSVSRTSTAAAVSTPSRPAEGASSTQAGPADTSRAAAPTSNDRAQSTNKPASSTAAPASATA